MAYPVVNVDGNEVDEFIGNDEHGVTESVDGFLSEWSLGHKGNGRWNWRFDIWIACHELPEASGSLYVG